MFHTYGTKSSKGQEGAGSHTLTTIGAVEEETDPAQILFITNLTANFKATETISSSRLTTTNNRALDEQYVLSVFQKVEMYLHQIGMIQILKLLHKGSC